MIEVFIARFFALLQRLEEWLLASSIMIIAVVTIANVFCRTVLHMSLTFAEEVAQFFVILVTFIGLSYAAGKGRHIRMSALYDQLGQRSQKVLMLIIAATTSAVMFALAYYSLRYLATVRALGSVSPALQVPLSFVYYAAPIGFVLTGLQYALTVARNVTALEVYLSYTEKDEYQESAPAGM